ncbi:MAG: 16S rRNA (guanine(966)-N(2))-methyltransferase RsmD [Ruminococcus flavefaciens]|nr:16S rRNA (guanine(966)-N(2))-methyltransferase RsmD [Ruminococcus flavefaciens]MCM1228509.1 16S rRNA (guanine(966)-N(2))-methyltransferase RsmD [Ruminococcus flavefaciens]
MRVITGIARGHRLVAPEGIDVRPTTEKVKEGVFSSIQFEIEGAKVLDLFAGSGQMGIEALSRGASRAVFVDSSAKSLRCINENLRSTKLARLAEVVNRDSYDYIRLTVQKFDIIILDPPYRFGHIHKLLPLAEKKLNDGGFIICEYEKEAEQPEAPEGMLLRKTYRYGKINVSVFVKPREDE